MGITEVLVLLLVASLVTWCSSRMAKGVWTPLKAKGSRCALPSAIIAFVLSFITFSVGILLVLAMAFGR